MQSEQAFKQPVLEGAGSCGICCNQDTEPKGSRFVVINDIVGEAVKRKAKLKRQSLNTETVNSSDDHRVAGSRMLAKGKRWPARHGHARLYVSRAKFSVTPEAIFGSNKTIPHLQQLQCSSYALQPA